MKILFIIFSFLTLISCNKDYSKKMQHGHWLGELQVTDDEFLPFNFEVTADKSLKILNAKEAILVDDITYKNDSVFIKMPVFGSYFALKLTEEGMEGSFINEGMDTNIPFKAIYNVKERFEVKEAATANISGNWKVAFTPGPGQETYVAKGIFQQKEQKVTGTFRTQIGDYRFLEGVITGNKLKMSAFDGSHAFLFVATVTDSMVNGVFYSGNN